MNLQLEDQDDCDEVVHDAQYTYEVTGGPDEGYEVIWTADPDSTLYRTKVNSAGGSCRGTFEHYSADGKQLLLIKPYEDDLVITGTAYFEVYGESQL